MRRRIKAVTDISTEWLCERGVKGVLIDLDNTIVPWGEETVAPVVCDWIRAGRRQGLRFCLLSNAYTQRARQIADDLQIPAIAPAFKPLPFGYIRAMNILDTEPENTVMIGDQLFTDILGARFLKIRAICVVPLSDTDFWATRLSRCLERFVLNKGE